MSQSKSQDGELRSAGSQISQNEYGDQSSSQVASSDQEMLDIVDQPSYQASLNDASMKSVSKKSRGPKKIEPQWSRVIDVDLNGDDDNKGHDIAEDIKATMDELKQIQKSSRKEWEPLFHPKHWWRNNSQHKLQENLFNKVELH